jgi:parallel beta-helix repeat protein
MRKTIIVGILLLCAAKIDAGNYYISSSSGNDTNDGKTPQTAWQSIKKLNGSMSLLLPGDSVLFQCNDTFWGQIIVSKSGIADKNIYLGSYGSGKKPTISGKTTVSDWTQTSTNIWQATCPDCKGSVTNFFINEVPQQIGRWPNVTDPNKGFRTYNSHSGKNQITDKTLSEDINWTGAEAVVRRSRWILDRLTIKSQSKGTLEFTTSVGYEFLDGFGYFIQNDPRTLDLQGEWYFNPAKKQFTIFSKTDPNTFVTKSTNCDNLINLDAVKYITIENLHFEGAGIVAININKSNNITIRNNDLTSSGIYALKADGSNFITVENNLVNRTNNNGLEMLYSNHLTIRNNIIKNSALVAGMGLGNDGQYYAANIQSGKDFLIEFNTIDSVGYIGLIFSGDSILIRNNVISNFCMVKDDGGGIYTGGAGSSRKLIGNMVHNAIGAPEGADWNFGNAHGIYMDDAASNVDILNNTIFNCVDKGIVIHNANHIHVKGNNVYNNGTQLLLSHNFSAVNPIEGCVIDSNNFVSKLASQMVTYFQTIDNGIPDFGNFDYNYYCRPVGDDLVFFLDYFINGIKFDDPHSLSSWSSKYNKDIHSGKSPISVNAYTVNSVNSSNYITNGTFDSNTNDWGFWAKYNNSKISFARTGGVTGGALHAQFTPASGKADSYGVVVPNNFALLEDKTYRLRIAAKSNKSGTTLPIIPIYRKNGQIYLVADKKFFPIDTTYKQFEYVFKPYSTVPNAEFDFQLTEDQGDLWIDNVELTEVDTTNTNPDGYIRFEYNATKKDTTIVLADTFVDVKGMPTSGNIILQPFTSIILFKKICSGILPATPDTIKGDLTVCPGTSLKYSIAPVPGATCYSWKLPNGWTGTSTSYDITTIAGNTGGTISVMARNVCDSSFVKSLNVTINSSKAPDQPEDISGNTSICAGSTNTFSIAAVSGANNYTWKLPDGWTGTSMTNTITAAAAETGGNIRVAAKNGCGTSTEKTLSVTVNPIPATPVITSNNGILHSNTANGNQWYSGHGLISNATNDTYVPSLKGNYYVVVTLNGCSSELSNILGVIPTGIDETVENKEIKVYPNPTTDILKIIVNNFFSSDYSVDIYNNNGGLLQTLKKSKSEVSFDLDLSKYTTGVYLIRIYNSDNYFQFKGIKK